MRWSPAGASSWSGTSAARSTTRWAATPTPGAGCSGRSRASGSASSRCCWRPVIRPPRHPLLLARFGLPALPPAARPRAHRCSASRRPGRCSPGMAAHSMLPLGAPLTSSFGLVLGLLAHAVGLAARARRERRRSRRALEAEARSLGVEIVTGHRVDSLADLPRGPRRPPRRHAPPGARDRRRPPRRPATGASWRASATGRACSRSTGRSTGRSRGRTRATARAGTVHLGGTMRRGRRVRGGGRPRPGRGAAVRAARPADDRRPVARARRASTSRGPTATCPTARPRDMTEAIEAQVERFAPGFRDCILARATKDARGDGGVRRQLRRRRHQRRHRATGASCCSGRSCAGTRTRRRIRRSSCARRRRHRAAASTACAARTRPAAPTRRLGRR